MLQQPTSDNPTTATTPTSIFPSFSHPLTTTYSYYNTDIKKIIANLYIGDEYSSQNKQLLYDLSIKHILVVGYQLTIPYPSSFNYLHLAVRDHVKQPILQYFHQTNKFIFDALSKKQSVLVHCAQGKSRSVTIVIAYLMFRNRMQFNQALYFVQRKKIEISPNQEFVYQLKIYEKELEKRQRQGFQ